jgi:hypothetical protein
MSKKDIPQVYSIMGMPDVQFKKYDSLMPKNDYDRDKAETLAEAMTELVAINKRKKYLETLLAENTELKPFLWTSLDGRVQALHTIDPGHFQNIIQFLIVKGRTISREVRAEATVRGVEIPEGYSTDEERFLDDDYEDNIDF